MTVLNSIIVEDEAGASNHLSLLIKDVDECIAVQACLRSIEDTVAWLSVNPHPDVAFFDIQLEDGLSFEIFKQCNINFPVIFTTAFDQYAIDAFKVRSIDYLLKPIKEKELRASILKYRSQQTVQVPHEIFEGLVKAIEARQRDYTLVIQSKGKLVPVSERDFSFFYISNGLLHGCTRNGHVFPIDQTIEDLNDRLNSNQFFRANRQFIVNRSAITEAEFYFNGRLSLKLTPTPRSTVLISKAKVSMFKRWLQGEIAGKYLMILTPIIVSFMMSYSGFGQVYSTCLVF